MKTIKLLALIAIFIGFSSCSSNDDDPVVLQVESESIVNLHAPQLGGQGQPVSGVFTKFNFATGMTTTSATEWDIAFRGTTIIVNGGVSYGATDEPERTGEAAAYLGTGTLGGVNSANPSLLEQDSVNGYVLSAWYAYAGPPTHLISPVPGKIMIIKTRDGKYAKMEILSYYKDAPDNPDAFVDEERYYTFNYVYQPNDGMTSF